MNTLVIYAHPKDTSYNAAIKDTVLEALKKRGDTVELRDLYAMDFNPVLRFDHQKAPDVEQEQKYISNADEIVIVNPIWWYSMPAILKGYIDRVLTYGFAYAYTENGVDGLLKGKRVTIINTAGGTQEAYASGGYDEALARTIVNGIYRFCGLEITKHHIVHNVIQGSDEYRAGALKEIAALFE